MTSLEVTEGSKISKGNLLAAIDSRESKLSLSELEAQLLGLGAERQRLEAEERLRDEGIQRAHRIRAISHTSTGACVSILTAA